MTFYQVFQNNHHVASFLYASDVASYARKWGDLNITVLCSNGETIAYMPEADDTFHRTLLDAHRTL